MKYTFNNISTDKRDEAMNAIMHAGGRVSSDAFSIRGVEGRYAFDAESKKLVVVIDDKPWLASWDMIEEKLNEYFN